MKFRAIEKIIDLNGIGPQKGGQMDRHELMEFLRGVNISITQNNASVTLPANPYEGDISAYVDGRWNDIQAHEASNVAGSIMDDQNRDDDGSTDPQFPATESEP